MKRKIKVLVVDDSMLFRKVLIDSLSQNPGLDVVGYAVDAFDAKRKIPSLKPDVITMDVEMPGMSGIEFLKELLPIHPIPVILVSSLNIKVFEALSAGAVDFVRKPDMSRPNSVQIFLSSLNTKVSIASMAKVTVSSKNRTAASSHPMVLSNHTLSNTTVIALGASTGGTEATLEVLRDLPKDTPGIVVTQHMPEGFTKMYAERLNRLCNMSVKEAKNGDRILPGQVLIAPGDLHMRVVRQGTGYNVSCTSGEKVSGHRPSVDVLFESMAQSVGRNAVGIIMTGMGQDGAAGLLSMRKKGAYTIGQDQASCVVYGMPMVAYNIGAVCTQASCNQIANVLLKHLNSLSS